MTNNNTFQEFLKTYTELKNEFYAIFEDQNPDAATLTHSLQVKLLEFLYHTFIPSIEQDSNPELFFERLKCLKYGENKPLLLNYLRQFGLLKPITDSTKIDSKIIRDAKNDILEQIKIHKINILKSENTVEPATKTNRIPISPKKIKFS